MRVEVTATGTHFEVFQGEKGMVRITFSEERWVLLVNHINARCEELHELKEKAKKWCEITDDGNHSAGVAINQIWEIIKIDDMIMSRFF